MARALASLAASTAGSRAAPGSDYTASPAEPMQWLRSEVTRTDAHSHTWGANQRIREFVALLDAMDELKPRVEAGVLVDERRWNLKLKSGIDIKLPESDPQAAIATLLRLQRESRILERDVLALDFRTPGRVFARLSEESAAAWAAAHAPKKAAQP